MILHVCVLMCSPLDTVTNGAQIFRCVSIWASFLYVLLYSINNVLSIPFFAYLFSCLTNLHDSLVFLVLYPSFFIVLNIIFVDGSILWFVRC